MRESSKALQAAVSAGLVLVHLVQALEGRLPAQAALSLALPALGAMYRFSFQQQLLSGFGFGPNLRYLRIANNNKKISDIAFKDQVMATVTQIENIYWDLVNACQQSQVNEQSRAFAQQSLEN